MIREQDKKWDAVEEVQPTTEATSTADTDNELLLSISHEPGSKDNAQTRDNKSNETHQIDQTLRTSTTHQ
jgi:hypothetical protein